MPSDPLQQRAIKVIEPLIPRDAEERVRRAFRQWNQVVREHIRSETALKLSDGDGRNSVHVRIVEGFAARLAQLIDDYNEPVLWRLVVGQPKLGGIIEGLNFLLEDWCAFEQWTRLPDLARGGEEPLRRALGISSALQQLALAEDVRKRMKYIEEDILGAYHFRPGLNSHVELYWMAIAMIAAMLDVRIEDLTVVVLAHELAHGYTHVGRDIDGRQWDDEAFRRTEVTVKEGLAQFYTGVVMEKLALRMPGPKLAYEKLLTLQNGPYLVHQDWLKRDGRHIGESVRFAMVAARGQGPTNYEAWIELLDTTDRNLSRASGRESLFDDEG